MLTTATQPVPWSRGRHPRGAGPEDAEPGDRHRLGVVGGLSALALDALASCAYGPEAIVVVLAVAGSAGLGLTLPVTAAIVVLLVVVTASYRQVIAAFPQGGGAYGVAKEALGPVASRTAAASLVVDYVLNVAVSVAAGVAALTSAVPALLPWTVELCLVVLAVVTVVNLRGIATSARWFAVPTAVYVVSLLAVIVLGLLRDAPVATLGDGAPAVVGVETVGALLLLRAFANGCAALTGVEAIANAVPSFRRDSVRRAQRAEVSLGVVLGVLLLGLAWLIERMDVRPVEGVTVLAQLTAASLGDGALFLVVQVATVVLLALAANTSFGGLPVLARLLAQDDLLPHVFALRAERQVHRWGILVLAGLSALLLVASGAQVNVLVPLFAIGVFIGFTLSQAGLVRIWWRRRPEFWQGRIALNAFGAVLTGVAAVVVTASKFTEGAWLVVVVVPALVVGFAAVQRAYGRIGRSRGLGRAPSRPALVRCRPVVIPVADLDEVSAEAISVALALSPDVTAVHVVDRDDPDAAARLRHRWLDWDPGVPLVLLDGGSGPRLVQPLLDHLAQRGGPAPLVLVAEVEPEHVWQRVLRNQRGAVLARALRRRSPALVCRMRFRVGEHLQEPDVPVSSTASSRR